MNAAKRRVYLDHNAGAPLLPVARAALLDALDIGANPSSVHREGRRARMAIETARRHVAELAGSSPDGVFFTSGASEAATTSLSPVWLRGGREVRIERLAVLDTDHPCLREGGRFEREAVTRLAVTPGGDLDFDALDRWLHDLDGRPAMLALCLANNETGVVQPLASIADRLRRHDVTFVVDAVQAAGRMPLEEAGRHADALLLSGHKIGAPAGVGAVALRDEARRPLPLVTGGGQERYRRAGTEALGAIAGFGAAALVAAQRTSAERARLATLRNRFEDALVEAGGTIVGGEVDRLPQTTLLAHPALAGETAQIALDLKGFAVSAGSACSSGKVAASHVLRAMAEAGAPFDPERGAIRMSFGFETEEADIDAFAQSLVALIADDRGMRRRVA